MFCIYCSLSTYRISSVSLGECYILVIYSNFNTKILLLLQILILDAACLLTFSSKSPLDIVFHKNKVKLKRKFLTISRIETQYERVSKNEASYHADESGSPILGSCKDPTSYLSSLQLPCFNLLS